MSPQSLLNTPVELLRDAPAEHQRASHGERGERRLAQRVVLALLGLAALAVVLVVARR